MCQDRARIELRKEDEQRVADADNPRGYYELNAVKALKQNNTCMKQAVDKAVKVVLPLLPHVPSDLKYHVILIERNLDEILTSQRTMLDRNAQTAHDPALLRPAYERLLKESRRSLENSPIARTLRLQHRWVLENPDMAATAIDAFLGTTLNRDAMAAVVDRSLHRAMTLDA